jgi:hypothetical protein
MDTGAIFGKKDAAQRGSIRGATAQKSGLVGIRPAAWKHEKKWKNEKKWKV